MTETMSIENLLEADAQDLLTHVSHGITKDQLILPSPDWIDLIFKNSDRNNRVLVNLSQLFNNGNLKNTGYLSILPVDQGVEHSAGSAFAPNPIFFDPENIVKLALEGGCSAVASTYGTLAILSRQYAHKIPFVLKLNHNELLSYPNRHNQIFFTQVKNAYDMGACAVGATIYFGSEDSAQEIIEVSEAFSLAHELGLGTILWCYLRNSAFSTSENDYHTAADLTGQANYLGATIGADIVKQKMPTCNGGFTALKYSKSDPKMYSELCSSHPIDLCRYQVANGYMGKIGLINSGGPSLKSDAADLSNAVRSAVINKRAGGMGLIAGRKAFQKPFNDGLTLLNAIQNVYLNKNITIA